MKVYMFNTENGLYEGETFVSPDMLAYEDGVTTVAPSAHVSGSVPVFDTCRQEWSLKPVAQVRAHVLGVEGACHENVRTCSG